jgi:hypothetical protein
MSPQGAVAVLERFTTGTDYLDPDRIEEAAAAWRVLVDSWGLMIETLEAAGRPSVVEHVEAAVDKLARSVAELRDASRPARPPSLSIIEGGRS